MIASLGRIARHLVGGNWSDEGTWETLVPLSEQVKPSLEEIEAARPFVEADILAQVDSLNDRSSKRSALRQQWDNLPAFIRGPYRPIFEAANVLLDELDDEAAIAMIQYTEPASNFTEEQMTTFNECKSNFIAALQAL